MSQTNTGVFRVRTIKQIMRGSLDEREALKAEIGAAVTFNPPLQRGQFVQLTQQAEDELSYVNAGYTAIVSGVQLDQARADVLFFDRDGDRCVRTVEPQHVTFLGAS